MEKDDYGIIQSSFYSHFFLRIPMNRIFSFLVLTALILTSLTVSAGPHFFDSPYQCLSSHTSKRSGKQYTTLHYYHPKKNWLIKLGSVKKNSMIKIANLYAPEGRYDGHYKGVYPEIGKVKFGTFWPNKRSKVVMLSSKLKKSDCQKITNSSVFDLPYLSTLECMDPKGTGSCKAIGR